MGSGRLGHIGDVGQIDVPVAAEGDGLAVGIFGAEFLFFVVILDEPDVIHVDDARSGIAHHAGAKEVGESGDVVVHCVRFLEKSAQKLFV